VEKSMTTAADLRESGQSLGASSIGERGGTEEEYEQLLAKERALARHLAALNQELQARNPECTDARQECSRLLEEQRSLLQRLQEVLRNIPEELPGVKFGHLCRSATRLAQVGGDFYDIFPAKHQQIGLLIGDVSGHGIEAARIASLVKDTVRAFAHQFRRPHGVLRETNRLLVEMNLPSFATAFLGLLDSNSGTLVHASAGHPPPVKATNGSVALLRSAALPLGVFADARYRDSEAEIQTGSLLLLYTDGLTEARRQGRLFGEDRLIETVRQSCTGPVEAVPSLLLDEALLFCGGRLEDDVAILAVEYEGNATFEHLRSE
jgi:sigma-B regulation protein RsbU (phosphoserine phosphatase)